jgi:BlaI family transcriptional regulator, penicillinase repressor
MVNVTISDAEMVVLHLLWSEAPLSATELAERAPPKRGWQLATVKTLLSRLVSKGAVRAEPEGRRFLYHPAIAREALVNEQAGRLVDRLFGGRVSPLVAHLAEQRSLSPEDLEELEALIRSLKS